MTDNYTFHQTVDQSSLVPLKEKYLESLSSPPDGMWEVFRAQAVHWEIRSGSNKIGYFCIDDQNQLTQFYLLPAYLSEGLEIFGRMLEQTDVKKAIVGTHHPIFLSNALHFAQKITVHSYLFRQSFNKPIPEKSGILHQSHTESIDRIIDFCHLSIGAPKEWLKTYVTDLVRNNAHFYFEKDGEIIGICEVRINISSPEYADIGMIVSPNHRKQGYGTFLLNKAKQIAFDNRKTPICSCERTNIASLSAIHNCGFVSTYRLLSITFE